MPLIGFNHCHNASIYRKRLAYRGRERLERVTIYQALLLLNVGRLQRELKITPFRKYHVLPRHEYFFKTTAIQSPSYDKIVKHLEYKYKY
jgi:hypothetical protein